MTDKQQKQAAKAFAEYWKGKGDEKQQTQVFWNSLLSEVFGIENLKEYIDYELRVKLDHTSFIDAFIPSTKVLIEQKSMDIDLSKTQKQSDGSMLTPYKQARRYAGYLPHNENPRWIIVCNFKEFHIHDMNRPDDAPMIIRLEELHKNLHLLDMLTKEKDEQLQREMEISVQAGTLVGKLYDAILKQYDNPEDKQTQHDLNVLCVRLVFCMYAEDAGLFNRRKMFKDYLKSFKPEDSAQALALLFDVLNTDKLDRKKYLSPSLKEFPYVNGGLFEKEIEIPLFNDEIMELLITEGSEKLDWSKISPTIFGAIFESTLNPDTRRSGGMHYTSIENIHKVIDPLFLDDLKKELQQIKQLPDNRNKNNESQRTRALELYRAKLSKLTFLDPAAGSGNFLTETYVSLRKLENEALRELADQITMYDDIIKVNINQFYGIEINDFAVSVATAALWIAESQMFNETLDIVSLNLDFLPLKSNANIHEGNALRVNWEDVVPKYKLSYIMGNPPFYGQKLQTKEQKEDMKFVFAGNKNYKRLDYVAAWYKKACEYMKNTSIKCALVSTNSICQGEMINMLWRPLFEEYKIIINFAHRTFVWDSDASDKAHVHCVIVGFSYVDTSNKIIFESDKKIICDNINAYLMAAPTIFLDKTTTSVSGLPYITKGSQLVDGGNYVFKDEYEYNDFINKEPEAIKYVRKYTNAKEYLNGKSTSRCLFLKGFEPNDILKMPLLRSRIEAVRKFREESDSPTFNELADSPTKYFVTLYPRKDSIAFPCVSSQNRSYLPIGFIEKDTVCTNSMFYIEDGDMVLFSLLNSKVHMSWMRVFAGRMKSDYRYSSTMVYNTLPVPVLSEEQKEKMVNAGQAILDARALYPNSTLAALYNDNAMPEELKKAHKKNNAVVMEAYGFYSNDKTRDSKWFNENEIIEALMKMYQELIK